LKAFLIGSLVNAEKNCNIIVTKKGEFFHVRSIAANILAKPLKHFFLKYCCRCLYKIILYFQTMLKLFCFLTLDRLIASML